MGLFGSSGIRRIADRSLIEIALKTGLALGRLYKDVVIGRDTRTSSNALRHALLSGLFSAGARCHDAGVVPTPTLALAARQYDIGVMVTASHNPPEYNGLKIINPDGSGVDPAQQSELEKLILDDGLSTATWHEMSGDCHLLEEAIEKHIAHILKQQPPCPNVRVVVDCGCGAGSVVTPYLLKRMGCDVVALNCQPSGFFPRDVEPTEHNLGDLAAVARTLGGIGIAHDGDADRMMAVDERGRFIPGDKLLVLLAQHERANEVVTTVDASMAVDEAGFRVTRTKVGDIHVSDQLKRGGDFGGEPSGAWVFPRNSYCPDGVYAAAVLVSIASQQKLSSLVDRIPQYVIRRGSTPNNGVGLTELKIRLLDMQPISVNESDGLRLAFNDGWLLVRPSGTEPKIRITAEARDAGRACELYERALKTIGELQVN